MPVTATTRICKERGDAGRRVRGTVRTSTFIFFSWLLAPCSICKLQLGEEILNKGLLEVSCSELPSLHAVSEHDKCLRYARTVWRTGAVGKELSVRRIVPLKQSEQFPVLRIIVRVFDQNNCSKTLLEQLPWNGCSARERNIWFSFNVVPKKNNSFFRTIALFVFQQPSS